MLDIFLVGLLATFDPQWVMLHGLAQCQLALSLPREAHVESRTFVPTMSSGSLNRGLSHDHLFSSLHLLNVSSDSSLSPLSHTSSLSRPKDVDPFNVSPYTPLNDIQNSLSLTLRMAGVTSDHPPWSFRTFVRF